jgi:hypothetical protein
MKVKELIKKLEKEDQEMDVVIHGYEGGVDDLEEISRIKIKDNVNKNTYLYGDHEIVEDEEYDREVILI